MSASPDRERAPMTIGEVLAELLPDFPDVTVSKIRFLDGAGLVDPQRSGSGYRRFAVSDLDRLRQVLTLQRDHYLPLKVIRGHIEAGTLDRAVAEPARPVGPTAPTGPAGTPGRPASEGQPPSAGARSPVGVPPAVPPPPAGRTAPRNAPPAATAAAVAAAAVASGPGTRAGAAHPEPAARADGRAVGRPAARPTARRSRLDELVRVSGLAPDAVAELEAAGLIRPHAGWYQPEDLVIASVAAQLAAHGVGPRHLRGLRSAADRELGLLEQSVVPVLRRGRPDARARAEETARTLRELYAQLHAALVMAGLRDLGIEPR